MIIRSTAKINLYLQITGKDNSDGYHTIDSLFQEISLSDEIEILPHNQDEIVFMNMAVDSYTSVHKALSLFKDKFKLQKYYKIRVYKNIPMGAGLGGGSSNAAFTLMGLADLNDIQYDEVKGIGKSIGSDVSFFFTGGLCRVTGKGEIVEPLTQRLTGVYFLIVYPDIHISTKWAYSLITRYDKCSNMNLHLNNSTINIDLLRKIVYNNFQSFVLKKNSSLRKIKQDLDGVLVSQLSFMSGSGSSLVYVYEDRLLAEKDKEKIGQHGFNKAFVCDPLYRLGSPEKSGRVLSEFNISSGG
ncbi:MAG: 4-(cytidine 5'-diphospho)-2-C-methyl-D-erythritol kinase [Thermodesulfobacteriota bacterium]